MPTPLRDHTVPWPPAVAADYRAQGFWAGTSLGTALRAVADRTPEATALVDGAGGVRLTHRAHAERADAGPVSNGRRPGRPQVSTKI